MAWDIAGIGNALMDALVTIDDDAVLEELGLTKGTMHLVDHPRWQQVYERLRTRGVTFDSGGSCANTIATAGRLGCRALYCGRVGDDQMGRLYASKMERATGQHALQFTTEMATGKCLSIISAKDAERTMLTDLGAAVGLLDIGEFRQALENTKIAHFTGYTFLPGPMQKVLLEAMAHAKQNGATISLDAADPFVVDTITDLFWDMLEKYTDLVFLNEEEAHHLTGMKAEVAVDHIAERAKVKTVVVKLGKRGSLVRSGEQRIEIPVHLVEAKDTTGAGDAYAGGFLAGLSRGWDLERCGRLASHVAAITVGQVGATVKDADILGQALRNTAQMSA
ncbi:MAG: adenosine kinase [Alphaproteobacteria bacterium]|nr:adenosine kinase [Alphaproteobacteria bacterium]